MTEQNKPIITVGDLMEELEKIDKDYSISVVITSKTTIGAVGKGTTISDVIKSSNQKCCIFLKEVK